MKDHWQLTILPEWKLGPVLNYEACFVVVLKDPTANLTLNKIRLDMLQIVLLIATYELLTILFQGLKKKGHPVIWNKYIFLLGK